MGSAVAASEGRSAFAIEHSFDTPAKGNPPGLPTGRFGSLRRSAPIAHPRCTQGIALMLLVMRQLRVPNLKVAAILLPGCLAYVSGGGRWGWGRRVEHFPVSGNRVKAP